MPGKLTSFHTFGPQSNVSRSSFCFHLHWGEFHFRLSGSMSNSNIKILSFHFSLCVVVSPMYLTSTSGITWLSHVHVVKINKFLYISHVNSLEQNSKKRLDENNLKPTEYYSSSFYLRLLYPSLRSLQT